MRGKIYDGPFNDRDPIWDNKEYWANHIVKGDITRKSDTDGYFFIPIKNWVNVFKGYTINMYQYWNIVKEDIKHKNRETLRYFDSSIP